MLDVIAAVLEELMGGKQQKQQPTKRTTRTRPPAEGSGTFQRDPEEEEEAKENGFSLEDIMRKMMGIDEPKKKPAPQRQTYNKAERGSTRTRPREEPAPVEMVAVPPPPPRQPMPPPEPTPKQVTPPAVDYAAKLRANPESAREAFVFSEIFGRPLGDR